MEINESNNGANGDKRQPGVLPYAIRQQILTDAERYFPSTLCPAESQTQRAFASAKADYIKERMRHWQKNSQTHQTTERSERDPGNQPDTGERDASGMRAQPNPIRSEASYASDTSDPADVVPPAIRAAMDFMAKFQAGKESRQTDQAQDIVACLDPRSPLDHLSPDKQRMLYDALCEFGSPAVNAVISKPEPEGWGIRVHVSSLKRFRARYEKRSVSQRKNELNRVAIQFSTDSSAADEACHQASERLLKLRLLETVNNPEAKTADIRDLFHAATRLRALALAEKRLSLAESSKTGDKKTGGTP